jgi:hypothetical protein
LHVSSAAFDHIDHNIEYTGVHDDSGARTDPHQVVREPLSELADDVDEQIIQCLEHVDFSLVIFESKVMMLFLLVMRALDLSKAHMRRQAVEWWKRRVCRSSRRITQNC